MKMDIEKVRAVAESIDDTVEDLCVDEGELHRYAHLQCLVQVIFDEIRIVVEDVDDLDKNSLVVDAYLAAREKHDEIAKSRCGPKNQGI